MGRSTASKAVRATMSTCFVPGVSLLR